MIQLQLVCTMSNIDVRAVMLCICIKVHGWYFSYCTRCVLKEQYKTTYIVTMQSFLRYVGIDRRFFINFVFVLLNLFAGVCCYITIP